MEDDFLKKSNLYALTSRLMKRVADTQQRLHGIAPNAISWASLGEDLIEAANCANEIARRIRAGEVR